MHNVTYQHWVMPLLPLNEDGTQCKVSFAVLARNTETGRAVFMCNGCTPDFFSDAYRADESVVWNPQNYGMFEDRGVVVERDLDAIAPCLWWHDQLTSEAKAHLA
jgi:hypothetical protein